MHRYLALASLLGVLPACLNPDISDEAPLTLQVEALAVGDAGAASDELVEAEDEGEPMDGSDTADDVAAREGSAREGDDRRRRGNTARRR